MRISCIKSKQDSNSFKFLKRLGAQIHELEDLEQTDSKLAQLISRRLQNNNYIK